MSATKRNKKSSPRDPFDYYPTPEWCVKRFLEAAEIPYSSTPVWMEPSAGDGAIIRAVGNFHTIKKNGVTSVLQYKPDWIAIEIQPRLQASLEKEIDKNHVLITDFLALDIEALGISPQVVITNPPYSVALSFIKKAIDLKSEYVCMLLRLNFLASKERSEFMRTHTPDVFVLPNRPAFTKDGTDNTEYAWFVWRRENDYGSPVFKGSIKYPRPRLVVLEDTPKADRRIPVKQDE